MPSLIEQSRQAVILAGGRGTRLRPLTDAMPKPMIKFHGKPFLEYLIEQIKEQGFHRILLLLGYLPNVIKDYFGDGSSFGVAIEYSISDTENDTGTRLRLAKSVLDPVFLLMYCDNYCPLDLQKMWKRFFSTKTMGQITIYSNKDGYTKHNVRIDATSLVEIYDKTRTADNLGGVEIGYGIFCKDVIDLIPDGNVNFEKTVYPKLVTTKMLTAFATDHRYYSVGSHARLRLTEKFLKRRPAVLLDRDGVINRKVQKGNYVTRWDEFTWIPGSLEALRLLKHAGYLVLLITNQAGIARGFMTKDDLDEIHRLMQREVIRHDGAIDAIYVCPHGWNDGCECRKPNPGMLFNAQRDFHLDLTKTFFIGDDDRDLEAGNRAGCPTLLATETNSLVDIVKHTLIKQPGNSTTF